MKSVFKQAVCSAAIIIFFVFNGTVAKAQVISPYLLGNNAWYDGTGLNNLWDDMALAKFQTIRIGGAAAEGYLLTNSKYITLINGIRSAKAEPIVQVPRYFTDQQVKDFITLINVTNKKNIRFWSIGNEPDHTNRPSTLEEVSAYIKRISSALKSVDSTILVLGPETAGFNSSTYLTRLLGGNLDITGKDANGNYYLDIYTWHKYMFTDINGLEADVNTFWSKVSASNLKRPEGKKITWGFTEFNSSYDNSKNSNPDQDVWSFHAGQLFAEVYGLGMRKGAFTMNAWSMLEGEVERKGTDLSLFDKDLKGRANYYHSLMIGQNMKKNYVTTTDNKSNVVVIPMADSTGIAVMILNKDHVTAFDYTLRLDDGAFVLPNALQIKVNAGVNKEITGNIAKEATQTLVFDTTGVLIKRYTYTSPDADLRGEPLVEFFSDDAVPVVTLTKPENQVNLALKSSVALAAEATDNGTIQKVEFTANGALIGKSTTAPYGFSWTPSASGTYVVAARAFDENGGVGFSTGTTVVVEKIYNYLPIPGTIQAEAFDEMSGIQVQPTTDTDLGQNVGYCEVGDWMDYTINVPTAGNYTVEARVASLNKTGAFDLKSGTKTLASFSLPLGTGGWQVWTTISQTVTLAAGNQTLRLAITGKEININWLKFTLIPTSSISIKSPKMQIYPNPALGGHFTLLLNGYRGSEPVSVEIFNLAGQNVYSAKHAVANNGNAFINIINDRMIQTGLYLVSVQSEKGILREKLFVSE